jgi:predicted RNA binding protein YcfA (HicA-like mRNA interferase family)
MSKLPVVSGKECIKILEKFGFYIKRQEGSHIILRRNSPFSQTVIPNHKTLDRGTLRAILRQADIELEEFIKQL